MSQSGRGRGEEDRKKKLKVEEHGVMRAAWKDRGREGGREEQEGERNCFSGHCSVPHGSGKKLASSLAVSRFANGADGAIGVSDRPLAAITTQTQRRDKAAERRAGERLRERTSERAGWASE